jgi:hypothetical protein
MKGDALSVVKVLFKYDRMKNGLETANDTHPCSEGRGR